MKHAWLGMLLLAAWGALLWPLLRRAAGVRGLSVRVASYPEVSADGKVAIRFEGAPGRARASIDGAGAPGTTTTLSPGLHTVGLDVMRRRRSAEQIHATVLAGPFAEGGWARCGARVGLSQRLLDQRIEPLVAELVKQALGDVEDLPGVSKSTVNLRWTARGMDVDLMIRFIDKTELTVSSKLAMTVAGDRVLLSRISAVSARIKGPMVDQALDAYVPSAIKKYAPWSLTVLHKVTGKAVRWYAQRVAQREASSAIDLELLPAALGILRLPPPIPLPGAAGARLELRFCQDGGLRLEPGRRATVAFDLRVVIPAPAPAPAGDSLGARGPVLARGAPVRPPATHPGPDSELTVEVSLDALNAALEGAWRAGVLTRALQDPALATRLDHDLDPLDFRARDLGAPLPPVLAALAPRQGGATLSIAAELATRLAPRRGSARGRDARLFARGTLAVTLTPDELRVSALPADVRLTCRAADHARPGGLVLSACYADLMTLITVALKTPGQGGLDDLALPLEAVVPGAPPTSPIDWTVERLALSAPDPAWLRLDARASFRAR